MVLQDKIIEPTWVSKDGQVVLYCADCLDVLPTLTGIDAVVTDPPYGIDYKPKRSLSKCHKWQSQQPFQPVISDDAPFDPIPVLALKCPTVMWGGHHYADKLPVSGGWLVWDKRRSGTISQGFIASDADLAWTNAGNTVRVFALMWAGLCRDEEVGEHYHPTQKPVSLMVWCIKQVGAESMSVLDPFMGSGTTGVAAVRLGCRFVGIEISETYFTIAKRRIQKELSQARLLPTQNKKAIQTRL